MSFYYCEKKRTSGFLAPVRNVCEQKTKSSAPVDITCSSSSSCAVKEPHHSIKERKKRTKFQPPPTPSSSSYPQKSHQTSPQHTSILEFLATCSSYNDSIQQHNHHTPLNMPPRSLPRKLTKANSSMYRSPQLPTKSQREHNRCMICLDEIASVSHETLRKLNDCGHVFHRHCIDPWLAGKHSNVECPTKRCPVCQTVVQIFTTSQELDQQHDKTMIPSFSFAKVGACLFEQEKQNSPASAPLSPIDIQKMPVVMENEEMEECGDRQMEGGLNVLFQMLQCTNEEEEESSEESSED